MRRVLPAVAILVSVLLTAIGSRGQMAPKQNCNGDAVSIVLNDSSETMTIEYRSNNEWLQLKLDAGKDGTVAGDRVRVATMRQDKAMITVDIPVEAGKKYRLAWNSGAAMWDLRATQ